MKDHYITMLQNEYLEKLYFFALKKTSGKEEAEDLTQEIVAEVLSSLTRGSTPDDFGYWLWRVAKNHYSKWAKRKNRTNIIIEKDYSIIETLPDSTVSIEDEIIYEENIKLLRRELSLLSSYYRDITVAYYINGHKISTISKKLGLPEGTVKRRLYESRNNLREGMKMARKNGQKSYAPENFYFTCSRFKPEGNVPDNMIDRLIPKNILLEAYNNPCTIEELSLELGIASPYMEDEVHRLEEGLLLKKLENGRYETDFVIIEKETQEELYKKTSQVCIELTRFLICTAHSSTFIFDLIQNKDMVSALTKLSYSIKGISEDKEGRKLSESWAREEGYASIEAALNEKLNSKFAEWIGEYKNKTSMGCLRTSELVWFMLFNILNHMIEITCKRNGTPEGYAKDFKGKWNIVALEEWTNNQGNSNYFIGCDHDSFNNKATFTKYSFHKLPEMDRVPSKLQHNEGILIADILRNDRRFSQLTNPEKDIVEGLRKRYLVNIKEDVILTRFPVLDTLGLDKFNSIMTSIELTEFQQNRQQVFTKKINDSLEELFHYYVERIQKNTPKRLESEVKRAAKMLLTQVYTQVLNNALEKGYLAIPEEPEKTPVGMVMMLK